MSSAIVTRTASPAFSSVERALTAIAVGVPVIVLDAEERENEGDFVVAAEKLSSELAHFMMSVGRGQMCIPVSAGIARRLRLDPLPSLHRDAEGGPAFAMPIDYCGGDTGVSPADRALTANEVVNDQNRPEDFVSPGHMFPLIARAGGVLEREGHTEASVDLAKLAGCRPAAVLCEICSRDGYGMARRDELIALGAKHGMPVLTIESLIEFRNR